MLSCSVVSDSLQPYGITRLLSPWNFPSKNLEWVAISSPKGYSRPRIKPVSPALQSDSLPLSHQRCACIIPKSSTPNTHPGPWKNYLPLNHPYCKERLETAALEHSLTLRKENFPFSITQQSLAESGGPRGHSLPGRRALPFDQEQFSKEGGS